MKYHARCHNSSCGKNFFHGKPRIFTCQILRGAMRVHACKSEVINERYCSSAVPYARIKYKNFTESLPNDIAKCGNETSHLYTYINKNLKI